MRGGESGWRVGRGQPGAASRGGADHATVGGRLEVTAVKVLVELRICGEGACLGNGGRGGDGCKLRGHALKVVKASVVVGP